ncbi:mCG1051102 [Mus musculus]|nr:mCG1051102 [Mus musculus]
MRVRPATRPMAAGAQGPTGKASVLQPATAPALGGGLPEFLICIRVVWETALLACCPRFLPDGGQAVFHGCLAAGLQGGAPCDTRVPVCTVRPGGRLLPRNELSFHQMPFLEALR